MTTVYTTQTVSMLANALGVKAGGNDTLVASKNAAGDVSQVTSASEATQAEVSDADFAHRLVLKDRLEGGAHIMSMVTVTHDTLTQITDYLKQTQDQLGLLSNFVSGSDEYNAILTAIDDIETEILKIQSS